ncbi:MAG: polyamine aminopropyltransferase [Alphaproteobacteria bacterium]|nr:polyamine aminopropyltransferase [Alphaproteobacteria bacterium]
MIVYQEALHGTNGQFMQISAIVHHSKSAFQEILVVETPRMGRVLILDGIVQTTEKDEFFYHEMLTHLPLFAHGAATRALIIGGGDGGILRECLKHGALRATMVEIDGEVVEVCRRLMPSLSAGAFADARAELIIADGIKYVLESRASFDLIIVDSTDPAGPGAVLFTEAFYRGCLDRLSPRGILVTQNGVPFYQRQELVDSVRFFRGLFPFSGFYRVAVPTYFGGDMALGWACKGEDITRTDPALIRARFQAAKIATQYYNPAIHQAAFAVPAYLEAALG